MRHEIKADRDLKELIDKINNNKQTDTLASNLEIYAKYHNAKYHTPAVSVITFLVFVGACTVVKYVYKLIGA